MSDKWTKDGKRWAVREKDRIAERFRSHVRKPSNPRGRIHREPCFFCHKVLGEAHHVDYSRPFLVAWLCYSHHRKVEHGTLRIPKRALWDYTSIVASILKPRLEGNQNAVRDSAANEEMVDVPVEGVPF